MGHVETIADDWCRGRAAGTLLGRASKVVSCYRVKHLRIASLGRNSRRPLRPALGLPAFWPCSTGGRPYADDTVQFGAARRSHRTDASIGTLNRIDLRSCRQGRSMHGESRIATTACPTMHNGQVRHERPGALPKKFSRRLVAPTSGTPSRSCSSHRAPMVSTYDRRWRWPPIGAMLAVAARDADVESN